jgi:hypothetical protein
MFKGLETVNDLNSVDPLGGFCGFIVFSSARFSGRLNPLSLDDGSSIYLFIILPNKAILIIDNKLFKLITLRG